AKPEAPAAQVSGNAKEPQSEAKPVEAANGNEPAIPEMLDWSFTGVFGHYDLAQLQRGYKVYKEVCSNCHSMKLVAFRNLEDIGYSAAQVKALAATYQVEDGPNDKGEMFKRPGRPADYFPSPFPNEEAGAAAYGKSPPDMSDLAKARGWERGFPMFLVDFFTQSEEAEGPDYIHAVLLGYTKPDDPKYNIYLPAHKIAMPKPLSDGQVTYDDGAPQTVDQYGKDVGAFLMWAAEPKLEQRKAMGFRVIIFLALFAGLLFFVKKRIWAKVGGDVVVGAPDTTPRH
ncbi:MAG: cytochrome c1, partial [Beijerinckiaceae bacterium]|nr:cytochrome c1 [Beijerinckiaceae bacterium]